MGPLPQVTPHSYGIVLIILISLALLSPGAGLYIMKRLPMSWSTYHKLGGNKTPLGHRKCELPSGKCFKTTPKAHHGDTIEWLKANEHVFVAFLDSEEAEATKRFWMPVLEWHVYCNVLLGPDHWFRVAARDYTKQ